MALWNIKRDKLLGTLAASAHGAVVTHSLTIGSGRLVIAVESETLLLWDVKTQSVLKRQELNNVLQVFFLKEETLLGTVVQFESEGSKTEKLQVRLIDSFELLYEFQFSCRIFHDVVVMKGEDYLVVIVLVNGKEFLQVIHVESGAPVHRIRLRKRKNEGGGGFSILLIKPLPHNPNQLVIVDTEHKGYIFDIKNKKLLRSVSPFSGPCSSDGKFGLHAAPKGGLEILDMRKSHVIKVLIPKTFEGVYDIRAEFSPCDRYILYYHSGQRVLKIFRTADGTMIGRFHPHANLTSFAVTTDGNRCLIDGEDGSLLITAVVEPDNRESLEHLAKQSNRKALAHKLGVENISDVENTIRDPTTIFGNLKTVGRAVTRFKSLADKKHKSSTCSIQ